MVGGHPQGQAGLPRATGTGEGDQAALLKQPGDVGHLAAAADEGCPLRRQVRGAGVEGPDRRELGGQAVDRDVIQMLRFLDVLQTVPAQVAQGHPFGERLLDFQPRGVAEEGKGLEDGGQGGANVSTHLDSSMRKSKAHARTSNRRNWIPFLPVFCMDRGSGWAKSFLSTVRARTS